MPIKEVNSNLEKSKIFGFEQRVEGYLSGKSIEKNFYNLFK